MTILQLLQHSPVTFIAVSSLLGLVVGSFLNVVIHRLPKMMEREWQAQCADLRGETLPEAEPYNLVVPRSACPSCGHAITALENIPVISWLLLLRGRCSGCGARISARYPLVEAITGALTGLAAWHFGFGAAAFAAFFLIWALVALTFIDLDTQLLPDSITLPLLWLGLLVNLNGVFVPLHSAVIGAVGAYMFLWIVYQGFRILTGKEGMGFGDFKLYAALGAWFGWTMLPLIILAASLVGAVVGLVLIIVARQGRNIPIPFGPYLAGGGLLALFQGQSLLQLYLG